MKIFNCVLLIFFCLSAKAQADTCTVGTNGCTWTCVPPPPEQVHCLIVLPTPTTCEIGASTTTCGTTCTCSQAEECTVGVNGCEWSCVKNPPAKMHCNAMRAKPTACYPADSFSDCFETCTCTIGNSTA